MSPRVSMAKEKPLSSLLRTLTGDYKPLVDIPDEFMSPDGTPRAHWLRFFEALFENGIAEVERRFGTADSHIREVGVSYRAYGDLGERTWPLSHLPLLIGAKEWEEIAEGMARAG